MHICMCVCEIPERELNLAARVRAWFSVDDVTTNNPCNVYVCFS